MISREDDIRAFGEWLDRRLENARFFETTTAVEDLPEDHPLRRRSEDVRSKSPVVVHVPPLLGGTLLGWYPVRVVGSRPSQARLTT